jgi:uncharacterized protein YkwD
MDRTSRWLWTLLLGLGAATAPSVTRLMASPQGAPAQDSQRATLKPAAAKAPNIPFEAYDFQTEEQLLALANQSRRQAGAPPLKIDEGLSQAARVHAQAMRESRRLSHQFDGEPALPQRLAATTQLQLEQEGENVALDYDAAHGHQHLMLSAPHRANLLNPRYNVVGLGVVRNGDRLYIVQDFGSALPKYSPAEVKEHVADAVNQTRRRSRRSVLQRRDWLGADDAACSMAQADRLGTPPVLKLAENFNVLTYTSLHPESLPAAAARVVAGRNLRSYSVGACYGRTETYPTGVYWVVLSIE